MERAAYFEPVPAAWRAPTGGSGVLLGLAWAAAVAVGSRCAAPFAVAAVAVLVEWALARPGEAERLRGLGVGALVGLAAVKGVFAVAAWGAVPFAAVPATLALLDTTLVGRRRLAAALIAAALAGGVAAVIVTGS